MVYDSRSWKHHEALNAEDDSDGESLAYCIIVFLNENKMSAQCLYLILSSLVISKVWTLTCYCQNSRLCIDTECQTSADRDVCYVEIDVIMNEQLEYEYGCTEFPESFSLSERCLAGPIVSDYRSMQCCNNETRCNEHLMPSPPYLFRTTTSPVQDPTTALSSETDRSNRDDNNQLYIGLTIAIPIFAIVLVIVMITIAIIYCFKKTK